MTTTDSVPDMGASACAPERVVIVGGGLAGLVVARRLALRGVAVELLERGPRLGGCVGSQQLIDPGPENAVAITIDSGTESFSTRTEAVTDLLDELGLSDKIGAPRAKGVWIALARSCVLMPETGFLGIPGLISDIDRTCGRLAGLRARLDLLLPGHVGLGSPTTPMSLGTLVRRRLGSKVLNRLVAPVVGNINLADPDLLDVDAIAPGLRAAAAAHGSLIAGAAALRAQASTLSGVSGLNGGFHQVVAALARDIIEAGGRIRTDVTVSRAVPSAAGPGWLITTLGPARPGTFEAAVGAEITEQMTADQLVFAGDAVSAETVLGPVLPGLPRAAVRGGVNIVTLLVESPELDGFPKGTGVLATDEALRLTGLRAKSVTHVNAKWAWMREELPTGMHIVRVAYGHLGEEPDAAEAREAALARTALHDASLTLGVRLTPQSLRDHHVMHYPPGLPFVAVGHAARVARVRSEAAQLPGLHLAGAWVCGTGVSPVVRGAEQVAADVLARMTVPLAGWDA